MTDQFHRAAPTAELAGSAVAGEEAGATSGAKKTKAARHPAARVTGRTASGKSRSKKNKRDAVTNPPVEIDSTLRRAIARWEKQAFRMAEQEEWAVAAFNLMHAANAEPHRIERWLLVAEWQRRSRNFDIAAQALETALQLNSRPDAIGAVSRAGIVQLRQALAETFMEAQQWDKCIQACEALLQLAPTHHGALEMLATAYLHSDQLDAATNVMSHLLQLSPRDPLHRLKLATLLHLQGRLGESLHEFERVADMYAGAPFTLEALEAIEMLDKMQIQQILLRASEEMDFRLRLQRSLDDTLIGSGFYLSESGHESLRHIVWDGRPDDETITPPRVH